MKKVLITEQDLRDAFGVMSAHSPLADRVVDRLFWGNRGFEEIENRLGAIEKKLKIKSKKTNNTSKEK